MKEGRYLSTVAMSSYFAGFNMTTFIGFSKLSDSNTIDYKKTQ